MYKDKSPVEVTDEDVELIAEVGYIASRVRYLEHSFWGSCFDSGPDVDGEIGLETDTNWSGGLGNTITSSSTSHKGVEVIVQSSRKPIINNSNIDIDSLSNPIARKRLLEDLLISFYEGYEKAKQIQANSDIMSSDEEKSPDKIHFSSYSDHIPSSTNNDISTSQLALSSTASPNIVIVKNSSSDDDSKIDEDLKNIHQSEQNWQDYGGENSSVNKRDCGDGDNDSGGGDGFHVDNDGVSGDIVSDVFSSDFGDIGGCKNEKFESSSSIDQKSTIVLCSNGGNIESLNLTSDAQYNLVQLKNTIVQHQFNAEDLRGLVRDLKRKVEYTERMNWLYLSKRPMGPPHRKSSLPKHTDVKKRFLEICDTTLSDEVKAALRLPAFDSYDWEDADVIHLMQTMFIELGLIDKFRIPIVTLREWLYEVYKHYNEVPFHNFRHCFCVAQMMYAISRQANLISRLGELEVLILLVSCICHDLDHPGYNNIYQINARTELALRYNDISPLENHHCSIAFRLLEHPECNIFKNFNRDTFNIIREGIIRCILATDMARHNEILTQFKDVIPIFDYNNRSHINLLCMVLIKVADISNEARPMDVAEPWLDRLLQEFFAQSAAEKSEGLPVTPFMDPDKVSKPGSQVRFIGLVLLPLFEALGELLPDLTELIIIPVRVALDYYKRLNDAQTKTRKSLAEANENSSDGGGSPQLPRSQSGISVRSKRSIPSQKSASRNSVDEPTCIAAELHDLPEGSESGDSETATEVDVAEKTSKFKVDTEGSNRSKSSHSTSRKSSREKRPSMISEMCSSGGRMRNSYGNIHGYHTNRCHFGSNRAVSLDQYSCNNRRLSDGLQQVISDSNVFYNRHNRSIEGEAIAERPKIIESNVVIVGDDVLNMNASNQLYDNSGIKQPILVQSNNKNDANSSTGNGNCSQNGTKSWKARFKQLTEIFSFSFDKGNKRLGVVGGGGGGGSTRSSPCSMRNNNADISKPGICCTISNNLSPSLKQKQDLINAGRNRAYSLDVPARNRYSSSSGGDSRKSSRNEDNSNKHDTLTEDNNSNNTSSGEVPSVHLRIGSDISAVALSKIVTNVVEIGTINDQSGDHPFACSSSGIGIGGGGGLGGVAGGGGGGGEGAKI